jgi:hypothetical protein
MIIFDLCCKQEHPFEGWFQSQDNYDKQLERGLISCPHCGSSEIRRVPSAVHLTKPANTPAPIEQLSDISNQTGGLAAYQHLISAIVKNCEDVGKNFAQEARKIYYMETPLRSIRGEASVEEYESLREEGIEVMRLPIHKKEDLN